MIDPVVEVKLNRNQLAEITKMGAFQQDWAVPSSGGWVRSHRVGLLG